MRRIRILFAVAVLALMAALPAEAEMFGPGFQPCGDKPSTPDVVECVQAKTNAADQRLNAAYKALQAGIKANQRQPLLAAQRLWVQYRDANCGFYGVQDGSIRQVQAAKCIRSMTEDRARDSYACHINRRPMHHRVPANSSMQVYCTTCRHAVGQFGTCVVRASRPRFRFSNRPRRRPPPIFPTGGFASGVGQL